jgi:N6-L-threonylcarbamoyladenine synthase
MRILAIETSCDETGIAIVDAQGGVRNPRFSIERNLVASQIPIHRPFGGVVPNLAKREHLKNLPILLGKIAAQRPGKKKKRTTADAEADLMDGIDLIAVTVGPGLEPALWTGIEFAKKLAAAYRKPFVGANHLEGHLYSFLLPPPRKRSDPKIQRPSGKIAFPAVALIVSGGHTVLLRMQSFSKWKRLGETRDDAAGEAFDKVARLLELPYPGGPEIEKLAKQGHPNAIPFPRPMLHDKNYDFSFSGLKTAVLYYLRDHAGTAKDKADVAASFEQAAVDVLAQKTLRAAETYGAKSVILCGGVAANEHLRKDLARAAKQQGCSFLAPRPVYNFDNAAMIGAAGYLAYLRGKKYRLAADGTLDI